MPNTMFPRFSSKRWGAKMLENATITEHTPMTQRSRQTLFLLWCIFTCVLLYHVCVVFSPGFVTKYLAHFSSLAIISPANHFEIGNSLARSTFLSTLVLSDRPYNKRHRHVILNNTSMWTPLARKCTFQTEFKGVVSYLARVL